MNNFIKMDSKEMVSNMKYSSFGHIYKLKSKNKVVVMVRWFFAIMLLSLFLPWTQNVKFKGYVTSLNQEDRPQQLNNIIPGKIAKWYVKEGDLVEEGDTILQIGEVKEDYFDVNLLQRTLEQIASKEKAQSNYTLKAETANQQINALQNAQKLKLDQLKNKMAQQSLYISIDSANLVAGKAELSIYERQMEGAKAMYEKGAISLTEYEKRNASLQNGLAKLQSLSNKLNQSRQEYTSLLIEQNQVVQEYKDKIAKAEGEIYGSLSNAASSEYDVSKLRNVYANYNERSKLYFILSPAKGQIGQVKKAGVGMLIKEGDFIAEINPEITKKAIEVFINPLDLPLIKKGQKIQFVFDGFPAFLFSGWPQLNYGTFSGKIYAIENAAGKEGKFRALVIEDEKERKWPPLLSIGVGANGIALLKDVRVFYEIWRNINGFPPEYYHSNTDKDVKK